MPLLPTYAPTGNVVADKAAWRSLVRAARRELIAEWSEADRGRAAMALGDAATELAGRYAASTGRGGGAGLSGLTVTGVEPMRTEPPWDGITNALQAAGARVLVPITLARPQLDWADLADPERRPKGPAVLAEVSVAFVPALAVSNTGVRLGQGGGYYDTTLPQLRELSPAAPVVAVVYDHELVADVPADEHDAVMDAVLRPGSGIQRLGG